MNLDSLFNSIMENSTYGGIGIVDSDNNKIINECIILDKLGGNKTAFNRVFAKVSPYCHRDGLLNETADAEIEITKLDDHPTSEDASVLAVAKEANSPDYELYCKAMMIAKEAMKHMRKSFKERAEDRLDTQIKVVENNPRITDAIEKVKEEMPAVTGTTSPVPPVSSPAPVVPVTNPTPVI